MNMNWWANSIAACLSGSQFCVGHWTFKLVSPPRWSRLEFCFLLLCCTQINCPQILYCLSPRADRRSTVFTSNFIDQRAAIANSCNCNVLRMRSPLAPSSPSPCCATPRWLRCPLAYALDRKLVLCLATRMPSMCCWVCSAFPVAFCHPRLWKLGIAI